MVGSTLWPSCGASTEQEEKVGLTYQQRKALKRLKVRLYRSDLRRFKLDELQHEFGAKSSGRIIISRLIRNLVYQAAIWMQRGKIPKVEGNLRSLFYQWVKPVLARIPGALSKRSDPYDEMLDALEIFIVEQKLFRYRDLDLIDENWENRWYTDGRNPHLLVFSEKTGFVRFLQETHRRYGLTAVALGGSPSHLSTEYLIEQLRLLVDPLEPLILFGITDYDPSGFFISRSFRKQLRNQSVEVAEYHNLIEPAHYTQDEMEMFRFPIPSKYRTRIAPWMEETGGLNGQPFGLEADSMPKQRLRILLEEQIRPYLGVG